MLRRLKSIKRSNKTLYQKAEHLYATSTLLPPHRTVDDLYILFKEIHKELDKKQTIPIHSFKSIPYCSSKERTLILLEMIRLNYLTYDGTYTSNLKD